MERRPHTNCEVRSAVIWRIKRRVIAFRGSLSDVNAVELIRVPGQTRRTGSLRLSGPAGEAELFYDKGSLVDVRFGDVEGMEALAEVVGWTKGEFEFALNVDAEKTTILVDLERALLDALRLREERDAASQATPPPAELQPEAAAELPAEPMEPPQLSVEIARPEEPAPDAGEPLAVPLISQSPPEEAAPVPEAPEWPVEEPLRLAEERARIAERQAQFAEECARAGEERARMAEERALYAEQQAVLARERAMIAEERAARAEEMAHGAAQQAASPSPDMPAPPPPHDPDPVLSAHLCDLLPSAPFLLHLSVTDSAGRVLAEAGTPGGHDALRSVRTSVEALRASYPRPPIRRMIIEDPAGTAVVLGLDGGRSFLVFADSTASLGSISVTAGKLAARLPHFDAVPAPADEASSHDSQKGDG